MRNSHVVEVIFGQNDLNSYFVTADRGVAEAARLYHEATPTRGTTACMVLNIQQRIIF